MSLKKSRSILTIVAIVYLVLISMPFLLEAGKPDKGAEVSEIVGYSIEELGLTQDEVLKQIPNKELVIVIPASYAPFKPVLDELLPRFKEQTGETYRVEALPENEMYDKIQMEMSAKGGQYDIIFTGANGAKRYGIGGFLIVIPAPDDVDDILAGDLDQYSFKGKIYGMPVDTNINLLYYRTDLLKEAGFVDASGNAKPPETWEEFREMAIKLTVDRNGNHPDESGFDKNNVVVWGTGTISCLQTVVGSWMQTFALQLTHLRTLRH
jgi:ABC-type glycerol-3-phosphate transport system substrate-binding protein